MSARLNYAGIIERTDGRFQAKVRYVEDGARKRTTITAKTKREVAEKRRDLLGRLEQGKPAKDRKITLAAWTEQWITSTLEASDRKVTTKELYARMARKHVSDSALGGTTLDKLTASKIEAWVVELRGRKLSQSTVRSTYTVLRAVLDTAVRDGLLGTNPAAVVKRPKVDHHEAEYLTPDQVKAVLAAAAGSRYQPLFALLVNTGMRRGEALALQWSDVDLTNKLVRVRGTLARIDGKLVITDPKTAKSRRAIPLSPAALELFRAAKVRQAKEKLAAGSQWQSTPYVFTTELGEPCDPRNALRAMKAAARKAGVPGIGLHTLRHSAASVMLTNGVPLKVVSEIFGHASVAITGDVYGHVSPDVSREAMDTLGTALG